MPRTSCCCSWFEHRGAPRNNGSAQPCRGKLLTQRKSWRSSDERRRADTGPPCCRETRQQLLAARTLFCSFVISFVRALQHRPARYLGPEAFSGGEGPEGLQLFANTKVLFEWRLSRGDTVEKTSGVTIRVDHAVARGVPLPKAFGGRLATASADSMRRLAAEAAAAASAGSSAKSLGMAVSCEYPSYRRYV